MEREELQNCRQASECLCLARNSDNAIDKIEYAIAALYQLGDKCQDIVDKKMCHNIVDNNAL